MEVSVVKLRRYGEKISKEELGAQPRVHGFINQVLAPEGPEAPWYELLHACQIQTIRGAKLENIYPEFDRMYNWAKVKDDPERRKACHRLRNKPRDNAAKERKRRAKERAESPVVQSLEGTGHD